MESSFELTAVAFLRSVGGRVRVLLAIDRDGERLFDGEPTLLVEHRPGSDPSALTVDGPDALAAGATRIVVERAGAQLVLLVEEAFTRTGEFDGERLLGRSVHVRAPHAHFDLQG